MNTVQPMDWSATAAWIALAISILSPLFTARLNNRHQLKLRKMDYEQNRINEVNTTRHNAITAFISDTGRCLSHANIDSKQKLGSSYHNVYAYVPSDLWNDLDDLYELICNHDWDNAQVNFPLIVHKLAEILKEPLQ